MSSTAQTSSWRLPLENTCILPIVNLSFANETQYDPYLFATLVHFSMVPEVCRNGMDQHHAAAM